MIEKMIYFITAFLAISLGLILILAFAWFVGFLYEKYGEQK